MVLLLLYTFSHLDARTFKTGQGREWIESR